ncbi:MAG: hypothetical protein AAGI53_08075 [Planctomycetota bacterium]
MRVRSDRSVNWWCAAALVAASGTAMGFEMPDAPDAVEHAPVASADASDVLDRVAQLLEQDKPVRAHALAMTLIRDASLVLTEAESSRAFRLTRETDRRVAALPSLESSLQHAELAAGSGSLSEALDGARLVLASSSVSPSQRARAEAVVTIATSRRTMLSRDAGRLLTSVEASLDSSDYVGAKSLISEIDDAGIELSPEYAASLRSFRDRIQQLEMVRGEPFIVETLSLGAFQPGQVQRRRLDQQPADPSAPAATPETDPEAEAQPADTGAAQPGAVTGPEEDLIDVAQQLEAQRLRAESNLAFDESRFVDADRGYTRLLDAFRPYLDAGEIAVIEERRDEARIRLGRDLRGSSIRGPLEGDLVRRDLARQQALAEINNLNEQADASLASGDYEAARRAAASSLLTLNNSRDYLGVTEYEQLLASNQDRSSRIREAEEAARVRADEDRIRALEQDIRDGLLRENAARVERINSKIDNIRALQLDHQYEKALQVTDELLFLDPNNKAGLLLKDVLTEAMLLRRYGRAENGIRRGLLGEFVENAEAAVPPDNIVGYPDDWAAISRRRGNPLQFSETPVNRAVLATLRDTRLPVTFEDAALEDVLTFLGQFANLEQDVDWPSLEEIGVDPESLVTLRLTNVPLETVYDRVLEKVSDPSVPAGWAVTDGVLTVASDEVLRRNTVLEIYDIRDLLIEVPNYDNAPEFDLNTIFQQGGQTGGGGGGQSPFGNTNQDIDRLDREELIEDLRDIIQSNIDPEGWEDLGGETGTIQELNGNLIITNTPKNHRAITGLLSKLRSVRNMQINVESRFLLVREEWFEQIGFDIDVYFGGNSNEFEIAQTIDPTLTLDDFFQTDANGNVTLAQAIDPADSGFNITQPVFAPGTQGDDFSPIRAEQNSFGLTDTLGGSLTELAGAVTGAAPALGVSGRFLDDIQVDFLVEATQADRRSLELTAPRLTFTNGQTAYVFVATQFSFVSDLQPVVSDSAVGFDPTISVVSEGVVLEIDGVISADRRYVTMNVDTAIGEVDLDSSVVVEATAGGGTGTIDDDGNFVSSAAVAQGEIQTPTVTITRVQTTVTVPDQGTILLGGQRILEEFETETGIPVLSKIPVLNRFFSNRIEAKEELTLLILLKPTVLIQSEEEERNFPGLQDALLR